MPARPGGEDRFRHIRQGLASDLAAADGEAALKQTRTVERYLGNRAEQVEGNEIERIAISS